MPSIVIAAHNEEAVLGACLDALSAQSSTGMQVVVSANGCTDRTADIARTRGADVIDRAEPGKAAALNAGDAVATGFPRIYLDADIVVPAGGLAGVEAVFARTSAALAVVPRRRLDTVGRPWAVRSYFAINERLPAFRDGLFGRGMIALSAAGRARFDTFPALIADDLFLDSQFSDAEKVEASDVVVVVQAPRTTRDLLNRLVRVRRGNAQMRAAAAAGDIDVTVRPSDRWAWLRVALREPKLLLATIPYVTITVVAGRRARRTATGAGWERDESTRRGAVGRHRGGDAMITNVCFHGIGRCEREREAGEAHYWVTVDAFARILDEVHGRPGVVLSFDDGNRSDADVALPALTDRGLTGTFFALAGRLDDPASLSPRDLVELRTAGMEIGSHGWAHIPWRGLSDQDVQRELGDARVALAEASGAEIHDAAMPLGRYDRRLLTQLKARDYRTVFTSDRFRARTGAWLQARYSVTAEDTPDSVRRILDGAGRMREARNALASAVKRVR